MSEQLTDTDFDRFRRLIYDESGIHFGPNNRSVLEGRIRDRLRRTAAGSVDSYYRRLLKEPQELKEFLDSVTTNLTRFFRNTAHFEAFEYFVIPELVEKKRHKRENRVRVWSAGCSTGEEPYSIAMVLKEVLPPDLTFSVIASDISLKSLMIGKAGFYGATKVKGIPERFLEKYFDEKDGGYQVVPEITESVTFDYHNLINDSGLRDLDVVFCRNVIIYFDEAAQKAAVQRLYQTMNPYSYLFIGHSESLFGMNTGFEFVKTKWSCLYRKSEERLSVS